MGEEEKEGDEESKGGWIEERYYARRIGRRKAMGRRRHQGERGRD